MVRAGEGFGPMRRAGLSAVACVLVILTIVLTLLGRPDRSAAQAPSFLGTLPGRGLSGLVVTATALNSAQLTNELAASGCKPESLAIAISSRWLLYVPGAPERVNAAFPSL